MTWPSLLAPGPCITSRFSYEATWDHQRPDTLQNGLPSRHVRQARRPGGTNAMPNGVHKSDITWSCHFPMTRGLGFRAGISYVMSLSCYFLGQYRNVAFFRKGPRWAMNQNDSRKLEFRLAAVFYSFWEAAVNQLCFATTWLTPLRLFEILTWWARSFMPAGPAWSASASAAQHRSQLAPVAGLARQVHTARQARQGPRSARSLAFAEMLQEAKSHFLMLEQILKNLYWKQFLRTAQAVLKNRPRAVLKNRSDSS